LIRKYTESVRTRLRSLTAPAVAVLALMLANALAAPDFDRMLQRMTQRFGPGAQQPVKDWRKLVDDAQNLAEAEKLRRVNDFFNRRIRFDDDDRIWGQTDYWATPLETLGKGEGDCEDFSIAKYFTLRSLNVPDAKLRLIYVRARFGGPDSRVAQAHMVLAYYASPEAEPLVLDNLISDIRPASRRADLTPVFSFNSEGLWVGGAAAPAAGGLGRLSRWQTLLRQARDDGFE